ncbi:MAG: hypothetical protein NTY48_03875, partial [Candidatus Diapherotrites archaeon]|nr:hypothetical protein [Candidatus Diapherotrites archaeon]
AKGDNFAFNEAVRRYELLLRVGVARFGSRKLSPADNLHNARLALWKTLLWGSTQDKVTHKGFLLKFDKEMKNASKNDSQGEIKRAGVRLDNPRWNWHDLIPDKKTSLRMDLMAKPFGLRSHFKSELVRQLILRERRKRYRHKKAAKKKLEVIELQKKAEISIERAKMRNQFWFDLLWKAKKKVIENPFLFKPSEVKAVFKNTGKDLSGTIVHLQLMPSDKSNIRKLLPRVIPVDEGQVKESELVKLKESDLEELDLKLGNLAEDFSRARFPYIGDYFNALHKEVLKRKAIPKLILAEIKKLYKKSSQPKRIIFEEPPSEDEPFPF